MIHKQYLARSTHLALDSSEDKRFHDEFGLRYTISLKGALLLVGFLTKKLHNYYILFVLINNFTRLKANGGAGNQSEGVFL